jgi:hypothetical protein
MLMHTTGPPAEVVMIFGILSFALVVMVIGVVAWQRHRKLKLLEEALRSGMLDGHAKRELLETVVGVRRHVPKLYRVGWLGMFVAAAMLFAEAPLWWESSRVGLGLSWWTMTLFVFALSLGAVTMPFAVRELHSRRQEPATRMNPR